MNPFWLIERNNSDGPPTWYIEDATGWHYWTPVAIDAKRFTTRGEAEAFPSYQMIASDPDISITEHSIIAAPSLGGQA